MQLPGDSTYGERPNILQKCRPGPRNSLRSLSALSSVDTVPWSRIRAYATGWGPVGCRLGAVWVPFGCRLGAVWVLHRSSSFFTLTLHSFLRSPRTSQVCQYNANEPASRIFLAPRSKVTTRECDVESEQARSPAPNRFQPNAELEPDVVLFRAEHYLDGDAAVGAE